MTGAVIWLTGLPASGKSTLARHLFDTLRASGTPVVVLDGDDVRGALVPRPGYAPCDRDAFYGTLARVAALLAGQGLVAIVAATASRRSYRESARALSPRFLEVYLDVGVEECRRRDRKGLYALADRGGAPELPGVGEEFELPERPDVVAHGGEDSAAVAQILRKLGASSPQSCPEPGRNVSSERVRRRRGRSRKADTSC